MASSFPLSLSVDQACLVQAPPWLSIIEGEGFRDHCLRLCQRFYPPAQLILDLGQTTFIDSSGIGVLATLLRQARQRQIELILWSPHPQVRMALQLTGMDQALYIEPESVAIFPSTAVSPKLPPQAHPSVRSKTKRAIDVAGSLLGLFGAALIFIPCALAIRLESPGPILVNQIRCGWMGTRFPLWRFRCHSLQGLPTRMGAFLQRFHLDKLPEFWNVLMGEMSLVGIHPPTPEELEGYNLAQWQQLNVKPGITGEWQLNRDETTSSRKEVVNMDLGYQTRWSVGYDLGLIGQTIKVTLLGR